MKIGIALVKKDEGNNRTAFVVQYDKKLKLIKIDNENVLIKTKTFKNISNTQK